MNKIFLSLLVSIASLQANAYNYFPLSPSWFSTLIDGIVEDKREVWRATVIDVISPTRIVVRDLNDRTIQVDLLHITPLKKANSKQLAVSQSYIQTLIGKQVYVLAKNDKKTVAAKLIDITGNDINMSLVSSGAFDLNTTSLLGKSEKQIYKNALRNAQYARLGIWQ